MLDGTLMKLLPAGSTGASAGASAWETFLRTPMSSTNAPPEKLML